MPGGQRLVVDDAAGRRAGAGDSIAVNGVCLTVASRTTTARSTADVSPETLRVTSLGVLVPGRLVNLERPVRADARMGGHFVLGHVDGRGTRPALTPTASFTGSRRACRRDLEPYIDQQRVDRRSTASA